MEFWKQEKPLAFFYVLSLWMIPAAMMILTGDFCVDNILIFILRQEEAGFLVFSIFLGFYLLWQYAMKEREKEIAVIKMLGTKAWEIDVCMQLELLVFQGITGVLMIVFFGIYVVVLGKIPLLTVLLSFLQIHLDIQIIFGIIGAITVSKIHIAVSEPFI